MFESWIAQYLSRNKICDEKGFPFAGDHIRYTGPGASDYLKAVGEGLRRMAYDHGAKNGTLHFLPFDQWLEHPGGNGLAPDKGRTRINDDYFDLPRMLTLAADMDMNGVALHPAMAEVYRSMGLNVPLILKVSGATNIGTRASGRPQSHLLLTEQEIGEAAQEYGAAAIGYTYYVGSPAEAFIARDWNIVRRGAKKAGLPLITWAYPRGPEIDKLGQDSFASVFGAVTAGSDLGAHVLKINAPKPLTPEQKAYVEATYGPLKGTVAWAEGKTLQQMLAMCVETASSMGVDIILSGGSKGEAFGVVDLVQTAMDAGVAGIINGRNITTTEADVVGAEANNAMSQLEILQATRKVLADYPRLERV